MTERQYFLIQDGVQSGPFNLNDVTDASCNFHLSSEVQYWTEGMTSWEPLSELTAKLLPPVHSDVDKLFPKSVYVGERSNAWIPQRNRMSGHFDRLERILRPGDQISYFFTSGSDINLNHKLIAIGNTHLYLIWRLDAKSAKFGGVRVSPDFQSEVDEIFDLSATRGRFLVQRKNGFSVPSGLIIPSSKKERFLLIDAWDEHELRDFFEYLIQTGIARQKTATPGGKGCLLMTPFLVLTLMLGIICLLLSPRMIM